MSEHNHPILFCSVVGLSRQEYKNTLQKYFENAKEEQQDGATSEVFGDIKDVEFVPEILAQYPLQTSEETSLPLLPLFVFPSNLKFEKIRTPTLYHSFTMTNQLGTKFYGFVLVKTCKLSQWRSSTLQEFTKEKRKLKVFLKTSFCVVSTKPFHSGFYQYFGHVLDTLPRQTKFGISFVQSMYHILHDYSTFKSEQDILQVPLLRLQQEKKMHTLYGRTDLDFRILLNSLHYNNVLQIFARILSEHQIIFLAQFQNYYKLTQVIEQFFELLYPLEYSYIYIPILHKNLLNLLETPLPYVFGMDKQVFLQLLQETEQGVGEFSDVNIPVINCLVVDLELDRVYDLPIRMSDFEDKRFWKQNSVKMDEFLKEAMPCTTDFAILKHKLKFIYEMKQLDTEALKERKDVEKLATVPLLEHTFDNQAQIDVKLSSNYFEDKEKSSYSHHQKMQTMNLSNSFKKLSPIVSLQDSAPSEVSYSVNEEKIEINTEFDEEDFFDPFDDEVIEISKQREDDESSGTSSQDSTRSSLVKRSSATFKKSSTPSVPSSNKLFQKQRTYLVNKTYLYLKEPLFRTICTNNDSIASVKLLKRAFLHFWVSLLQFYRSFLHFDPNNPHSLFQAEKYFQIFPNNSRKQFLQRLERTQYLQYFLQKRIESFQKPNQPELKNDIFENMVLHHMEQYVLKLSMLACTRLTGFLYKKGKIIKNWKFRYFVLESNELKYFEQPTSDLCHPKGKIAIIPGKTKVNIPKDAEENYPTNFPLIIWTEERELICCAENEKVRRDWYQVLRAQTMDREFRELFIRQYQSNYISTDLLGFDASKLYQNSAETQPLKLDLLVKEEPFLQLMNKNFIKAQQEQKQQLHLCRLESNDFSDLVRKITSYKMKLEQEAEPVVYSSDESEEELETTTVTAHRKRSNASSPLSRQFK